LIAAETRGLESIAGGVTVDVDAPTVGAVVLFVTFNFFIGSSR
jgi:hypothetical protein